MMKDDVISRQETIEAMESLDWYHINKNGQLVHGANSKADEPLYKAEDVYKVLNGMSSISPSIIYCRKCKYHHYDNRDFPYCEKYGYGWRDNDFCSCWSQKTD